MYKRFLAVLLLPLGFAAQVSATQPQGWYYPLFFGRDLWQDHRIEVYGHLQGGLIYNDNGSSNVFPSGFLNTREGAILNRAELLVERPIRGNYKPRVGPLPGDKREKWDWGFLVHGRYGEDFSRTFGFDDELDFNEGHRKVLTLPQWFVTAYAPWGGGTTFQFGSWFTNIGAEAGTPRDPPSPFYTRPYAFLYGPAKHFGGLMSTRLPIDEKWGLWGLELGVVQGWNNVQDNNSDKSVITALQWRSPDMTTWVDLESIWGNEQSENGVNDQRPFTAISSNNEGLFRQFHSLTLTKWLKKGSKTRVVLNAVYGDQEGGDVASAPNNPPGFLITENSQWYGWNGSFIWQARKDLQFGIRYERFTDRDGAFFALPEGRYNAWTLSASWFPEAWLRIRPEIRYDRYQGEGRPFGGSIPTLLNGTQRQQTLFSIDATLFL